RARRHPFRAEHLIGLSIAVVSSRMRRCIHCNCNRQKMRFVVSFVSVLCFSFSSAAAGTVTFAGESPGPTPFIALLDLTISPPNGLQGIRFEVRSKPGSVVRPIRADYSRAYLIERGYLDPKTGALTLPVFGLYADFDNTV